MFSNFLPKVVPFVR